MGTRADFYVGRGKKAEWLGSIAWDGYPGGLPEKLLRATNLETFRANVEKFFKERKDVTRPAQGWPWPWGDSGTTDFSYAFDRKRVFISQFGGSWYGPKAKRIPKVGTGKAEFPDMSTQKNVTLDSQRSGLIILGI